MKHFFHQPPNIAIIREKAIVGIIVLLLMGFVGPFNVNEVGNSHFLHFVVTMTNRSNSYQLDLFGVDKQIPVSRSYTSEIKERLQECKNNCTFWHIYVPMKKALHGQEKISTYGGDNFYLRM